MSESSRLITVRRIEAATQRSQIAAFRAGTPGRYFAMFADTVAFRHRMKRDRLGLIGIYHGQQGVEQFMKDIAHLERRAAA